MGTQDNGIPDNITNNLPTPVSISSSTNASPIVLQTASAHGCSTGDRVMVSLHQTNTNANGEWTVTFVDSTHISLNGSTGNGVGGATGSVQPLTVPTFLMPSDGDTDNSAVRNVPATALADRTACLFTKTGAYKLRKDLSVYHDDAFGGGTWANCNISSTNTPTAFTGGTLPQQAFSDCIASDLIEVQLDFTLTWGGGTSPANGMWLALYYATQQPGGAVSAYARLLGSSKFYLPYTPGSARYVPITLRGHIQSPAAPIVLLAPYGFVATGGGTGQVNLYSDFVWTFRQWRPTGLPQ